MHARRLTAPHRQKGLSLLELVVAIAVLSIGTLAVLKATGQARHVLGGADTRLLAQLVAENHAQALRLGTGQALPDVARMGHYDFAIDTTAETTAEGLQLVTIVVRAQDGPAAGTGTRLVTVLPPGALR